MNNLLRMNIPESNNDLLKYISKETLILLVGNKLDYESKINEEVSTY